MPQNPSNHRLDRTHLHGSVKDVPDAALVANFPGQAAPALQGRAAVLHGSVRDLPMSQLAANFPGLYREVVRQGRGRA